MHTDTLNIVNSNDLQVLSQICARIISENPLPDPFMRESILVMNSGMKTYLSQELANYSGVQANCRYVHVWQIIWEIYKSIHNLTETRNPFSSDYLRLNIFSLRHIWEQDEGEYAFYFHKLADYTQYDVTGDKAYELSGRIADIFDQYQMYRTDYILEWNKFTKDDFAYYMTDSSESGAIGAWIERVAKYTAGGRVRSNSAYLRIKTNLEENIWQIRLWCLLRENLDLKAVETQSEDYDTACLSVMADRAQMLDALKRALKNNRELSDLVPQRIFVFGVSSLPVAVIEILQALSTISQVFIMLLNPCAHYWGDIKDSYVEKFEDFKKLLARKYAKDNMLSLPYQRKNYEVKNFNYASEDYTDGIRQEGNALLLSLGRQGRDNLSLLMEYDESVNFISAFADIEGTCLLSEIKRRLLELDESTDETRYVLRNNDRSLEIHSCHTKMREVEVLKDKILELFNSYRIRGQKLRPRDIVVMVPAINAYAPYIQSVFSPDIKDEISLPYAISDRSSGQENAVADALISLLGIDKKRITSNFILDMLTIPAIASKFDISSDDLELIGRWFNDNNVLWGIDDTAFLFDCDGNEALELGEHLPFTFGHGLKRMVEGTLLGSSVKDDVYLDIEGSDLKTLSSVYSFIYKVANLKQTFIPSLALEIKDEHNSSWQSMINKLIADFFDTQDVACQEVIAIIAAALDDIAAIIGDLKQKPKITLATFRSMLESEFSKSNEFSPFLRDKINFCSLVPMRAVPFEHVFVLGLNDGEFPRQDVLLNFNLMSVPDLIRRGDRSASAEDRFLFLEAIISARQSLYLSYIGRDAVDNSVRNPSIVLSELLDYLSDSLVLENGSCDEKSILSRLIKEERLHGYDADNFLEDNGQQHVLYHPSFNRDYFYQCIYEVKELDYMPYLGFESFSNEIAQNLFFDLSEVEDFLRCPCRFFLKRVLDIYVSDVRAMSLADHESFALGSFDINLLFNDLIESLFVGKNLIDDLFGVTDENSLVRVTVQGTSYNLPPSVYKALESFIEDKRRDGSIPYGVFAQEVIAELKLKFCALCKAICAIAKDTLEVFDKDSSSVFEFMVDEYAPSGRMMHKIELRSAHRQCNYKIFAFNTFEMGKVPYKVAVSCALYSAFNALNGFDSTFYAIDSVGSTLCFNGFTHDEAESFMNEVLSFMIFGLRRPQPWCDRLIGTLDFGKEHDFEEFIASIQLKESGNASFDYVFNDVPTVLEHGILLSNLHDFFEFYTEYILQHFGAGSE